MWRVRRQYSSPVISDSSKEEKQKPASGVSNQGENEEMESDEIERDEDFSDSFNMKRKYKDVAEAAQQAFESAAYAAAAARAAVELSRSESTDPDDPTSSNLRPRKVSAMIDPMKSDLQIHEKDTDTLVVKGFTEGFETPTVLQHNYVEDYQFVGESIEKLFNRLSVLLFQIDKQMSKILLQGRYLPKKLVQWSTEARALKGRVSDLLKEQEIGKDHYRKRVKLVEMGIEMVNHLKKCPFKDELMYDKPTPVIVLTRKPGINEPSTGLAEEYKKANTKFESFGKQRPYLIPWHRSVVAEELKKTNDVGNEPISTSESLWAGENEMDAASISKADSDQQSTTESTEKGMMWETKMSSSSTEQETELPKLTEHLQTSVSCFDSQQEVKLASCEEIQSVCETTPMEGAKNLSVEKRDIESSSSTTERVSAPVRTDNSHFIPEMYHEDTSEFVDMNQETSQPSSNTVPENEHYLVVVKDNHIKLQLDHQTILIGDHPLSSSTTPLVMNLAERDLRELTDKSEYPNPFLLFLQRNNRLTHIHSSFFDGMNGLCFLDLSNSKIRILPGSLFGLSKLQVLMLRNCVCLDKLPTEIGKLKRLEVLDLSGTELYDVPDEIGRLTLLRHMQLSFMDLMMKVNMPICHLH